MQYNAENGVYVPEKDSELTDAQLQEILTGLAQPETVAVNQFAPLDPLAVYGSKSRLDVLVELDNPIAPGVEAGAGAAGWDFW